MSVIININGLEITGNGKALNGATIRGGSSEQISITNTRIKNSAELLQNLDIGRVDNEIKERIATMDKSSAEYWELRNMFRDNKKPGMEKLREHIARFTEGVAAQVIANFIGGFMK